MVTGKRNHCPINQLADTPNAPKSLAETIPLAPFYESSPKTCLLLVCFCYDGSVLEKTAVIFCRLLLLTQSCQSLTVLSLRPR